MLMPLLHTARLTALIACSLVLASCATNTDKNVDQTVESPELETINANLESVYANLQSLRHSLNEQYSEICEAQQAKLESDYASAKKRLLAGQIKYTKLEKRCEAKSVIGKLLMGEVENVSLLDEKLTFSARIDTGAETSSLGVYRMQDFERDGKTWVKFKLVDEESAPTYEYRVNGRVNIKQGANSEGDERFEIKMNIRIGNKDYSRQVFNLADRSYLDHQVLIGRSFLTDVAIVDTGSKYRLKK